MIAPRSWLAAEVCPTENTQSPPEISRFRAAEKKIGIMRTKAKSLDDEARTEGDLLKKCFNNATYGQGMTLLARHVGIFGTAVPQKKKHRSFSTSQTKSVWGTIKLDAEIMYSNLLYVKINCMVHICTERGANPMRI